MIEFCPWAKGAIDESPQLKEWIKSWAGNDSIFLQPHDWFTRGHDHLGGTYNESRIWYPTIRSGIFVWSPPPAAADVCLEELRKARMKRKNSLHVVCVQRLMTPLWLKQLNKAADCLFVVPTGHHF